MLTRLVHEARRECRQWGNKKIHFLHVPRKRNTWADYLSNVAFNRRAHVTLAELGVDPPLHESAPRLVQPTKSRGRRAPGTRLDEGVGEPTIAGVDMSAANWHLRGQGPDR